MIKLTRQTALGKKKKNQKTFKVFVHLYFCRRCVCMCVAYASGLTHTILYQSSHLTAPSVALKQSADVTVIV